MILAGDIGGTKTDLALYSYKNDNLKLEFQHQFASQMFSSFNNILHEFKKLISSKKIKKACFGIAGPIIDGNCKTTNLPWYINTLEIKKSLNIKDVKLLNDLEATAYGMLHLKESQFISLNPNAKSVDANRAVIASGTGLGEAILFFDGKRHHAISSEGGHTDFAPTTQQQDNLLKWLRKEYPTHVSYERVLSGSGIYTIYKFLYKSGFAIESQEMKTLTKEEDKSAKITQLALEDNDKLSKETLRLFCEIYGSEAGNLVLKGMARGGLYIGGGIATKILPFMKDGTFMKAFKAKGRFTNLLNDIEVKISLNDKTALLGSAYYCTNNFVQDNK